MNIPHSSIRETKRGQDGKEHLQATRSPCVPNGAPPASPPAPFPRGPALELGRPLPMCSSWRATSGPSFQKPSDPSPVTSACWLLLVLIGSLVFSSLLLTCLDSSNSLLVGVLTSLSPSQQQSADLVLFLHG